jgi:outer membrane protein assembly factor BamB
MSLVPTRREVLAAAGAGLVGTAGCLEATDAESVPPGSGYPMDRYDARRTGRLAGKALEPPTSLAASWSLSVAATSTPPPSIHGGRAYVNDWDGTLHALDATDGTARWTAKLDDDRAGGTRPTVTDEAVYTAASSGLFAHDHEGGRRWHVEDVSSARGTPAAVDGTVYVTYVSTVKAFDAETGDRLWSHTPDADEPGTVSLTRSLVVADGTVYAVRHRGGSASAPDVIAIDAADGTERWRARSGLVYHRPVVAPDGSLLTVGQKQVDTEDHLAAWDVVVRWTDGGESAWRTELEGYRTYTPPAVDGERVYAPTTEGIEAVSLADGKPLWQAGGGLTGAPVVAGDHVWVRVGDRSDGELRVYTRGGEAVGTYGAARARPAVTENAVYLVRPGSMLDTLQGDHSEVVALVPA